MNDLVALSTLLVTISLATERLVTIIKTLVPKWLADETNDKPIEEDRGRRLSVQLISFLAAWLTSSFFSEGSQDFFGKIKISATHELYVPIVAVLCMGGSAFWTSILGYAKAVKDVKQAERKMAVLRTKEMQRMMNTPPPKS